MWIKLWGEFVQRAVVVLWRFHANAAQEHAERRASRIAGALLFALAGFVVASSVTSLQRFSEPKPTTLGITILVAAAVVPRLVEIPQMFDPGRRFLRVAEDGEIQTALLLRS